MAGSKDTTVAVVVISIMISSTLKISDGDKGFDIGREQKAFESLLESTTPVFGFYLTMINTWYSFPSRPVRPYA